MTGLQNIDVKQLRQDIEDFVDSSFSDVELQGAFIHGSLPNNAATVRSDIDILLLFPDGVSDFVLMKCEGFEKEYSGHKVDAYAVRENESIEYLRGSCTRNGYQYVYDIFEEKSVQSSEL